MEKENTSEAVVIAATALVEEGVSIGPGSKIWHNCHIRTSARLGSGVVLGMNVFVDEGVEIHDRVHVQNNVSVYKGVTLKETCFIGPGAVFTNDLRPRSSSMRWAVVPTMVERGASVGANATVVCGVTLGEWSMVAAGSVVTADVEPFELVAGNPATHKGWVCSCGARIASRGDAEAGCAHTAPEGV